MKTQALKKIIATMFAILSIGIFAYSQPNLSWTANYNSGTNLEEGEDVHYGGDGRVYVCGISAPVSSPSDALVISYTGGGSQNWSDVYNGSANGSDNLNAITSYGSGSSILIYATGNAAVTSNGSDMLLLKYTQSGTRTVQTWNGTGTSAEYGNGLTIDASGYIYVFGTSSVGGTDIKVWKYNSSLVLQYVYTYNSSGTQWDSPDAMKLDASGNYLYVTGHTEISGTNHDAVLIKLSTSTLTQQWVATWDNSSANNIDQTYSLDISSGGDIFTCGKTYVNSTNSYDGLILRYNTSGSLVGSATIWNNSTHSLADFFQSIATTTITGTTYVYVTGTTTYDPAVAPCDLNIITNKYTVSGTNLNQTWSNEYDAVAGLQCPSEDEGFQLLISPNTGKIFVGGYSVAGATTVEDYCFIRYNPNGTQEWVKSHDRNSSHDRIHSKTPIDLQYSGCLDVDFVYITGFTTSSGNEDATTIKYYGSETNCLGPGGRMMHIDKTSLLEAVVFPNPFSQIGTFKFGKGETIYENSSFIVYDLMGKEVKRFENLSNSEFTIDMVGYSEGLYFYKYVQSENVLATGKFILKI